MENTKPARKSLFKFLTLIPKTAASFGFQNPQFSPGREKQRANQELKNHMNKGFSGPISIIPQEARNKSKNSETEFDTHEPTSPRISCMGQIKNRKKLSKKKNVLSQKDVHKNHESPASHAVKKKPSNGGFLGLFGNAKCGRKSSGAFLEKPKEMTNVAPNLGQMRRFASGRESLANFDWTKAQIAPGNYSDEESRGEEYDEEVMIPFSAPIPRGGGEFARIPLEAKKEINIWKRRTMVQPRPLNMDTPN
ncbi:hypothetical protein LIER_26027 [Lithospermum erythrorhizon]|uniref:Syringolide-induced protein 14-1-1 n=1 Tax=Lithospermum erythrorhizon TaxID=34254 RepID=A0AAV3RAX3_LITER